MMNGIFSIVLDLVMIGMLAAAIYYAVRLSQQMMGLSKSRAEMERFVLDFNATVQRAEAGIKGLKHAARTGGDDLEQLIDKAQSLRDELQFLVDSADKIANRLSEAASSGARDSGFGVRDSSSAIPDKTAAKAQGRSPNPESRASSPVSAAERELMNVLKKLG